MPKFPKSARLLKKADFRFRPYKKFITDRFSFYFKKNGAGRLGISISKKVLKRATDRNRVKRLLREVYRETRQDIPKVDVHVVARESDMDLWRGLRKRDVTNEWNRWAHELQKRD